MKPDKEKTRIVQQWPTPSNASETRKFLGLASYYRRYIKGFATIAEPLHRLTDKETEFSWDSHTQEAFEKLKTALSSSPILACPDFSKDFVVFTDASDTGLGAVVEQNNHVIAYASRTLKQSERNYSVIEKECLAVVHALKTFRHYLLGRPFTVYTDHNPLQWLHSQKMQGRLAVALQEYDFIIKYRKGNQNSNADALSRCPSEVLPLCSATGFNNEPIQTNIRHHQQADKVTAEVMNWVTRGTRPASQQCKDPKLRRLLQLWPQLYVKDGILLRKKRSALTMEHLQLVVVPQSLQRHYLQQCHDAPMAGHQGWEKTLERLQRSAYWVGMAKDVQAYCSSCDRCQLSKPVLPMRVPLTNTPIGRPMDMVAVDVLKVPVSVQGNSYLLVIQDYFTKWLEAIPMRNQTADTIVSVLINVFSQLGLPLKLHSDQGASFESAILKRT